MKAITKTIYRSSVTGRLVTQVYAKKHPRTTQAHRVRVLKPVKK